jgi:hypothetical protein
MSAAELAPYENRAAEAEARLDALEAAMSGGACVPTRLCAVTAAPRRSGRLTAVSRVSRLSGGAVGDAFRVEMIVALRDVRQQLGAARCAQKALQAQKDAVRSGWASARVGCRMGALPDLCRSPHAPAAQAEAAVAMLRADNDKLRYRVGHLVRSLREADAARPPPPPPPLERFSTTPFDYKSPLKAGGAAPPATP